MTCDFCGKNQMSGNKVSHSNIKTRTRQEANVQRVRAVIGGRHQRVHVCTRCLRSGKITKSA